MPTIMAIADKRNYMPDLNHWQMLAARARTGYQIIVLMALGLLAAHAQPLQPEVLADLLASPPYFGNLVLGSDGCFYGTTDNGGSSGNGTVFKVTTNGTLTTLVSFGYTNGSSPNGLTVGNDGNFYGTTYWGGASGYGTVFEITPNGGLTSLNSFTTDYAGRHPQGTLVQGSDGNLYGTTQYGPGDYGVGTIFKVTTNGTLTTLVDVSTNNGRYLNAGLTLGNDGYFYGTTWGGGANSFGNIFKVTTDGALTTIASFNNDNGSHPEAALALGSAGYFYGTANEGGSNNHGTVFQVTTNGTLTALVSFDTANGANPTAGLTVGNDGNFYGTTQWGGSSGAGTVFQVTTNGTLGTLVSFANTNGSRPNCLTVGNDGNYYGTTVSGGSYGAGVVFRLSPREPLILRQPQPASQVVPAGVSITIYASVFGALPLSYQWVRDATNLLPGAINATLMLTNVSPAMSGNYALRVTNSLGIASSSNAVLTVLPSLVATLPVSGISATGALLGGSVTLGAAETLAWFQWGSNINYGQTAGLMDIPGGSGTVLVTNALKGLDGKLIYHYRIAASNSFGTTYGVDQTFQVGLIPAAATGAATGATTNDVILNAVVNPDGRNTTAWFKWGTTTSYGHVTPATSVGSGSAPLNFSNLIAGLSWNTTYHCQIVASNNLGLALGGDSTFRFGAPLAVTEPATTLTGTKAWLVGLVAPNLFATTAWFDWGTNTSYGSAIFLGDVGRRGGALAVSNLLTGLDAALTYHFRVVASNSLGIAYGADAQINTVLYAYAQSVLADQPLVYYRFDEASGNTALNSGVLGAAGNGTYNATVALGNPSLVPVFGSAAGFNKSNSAVAVPRWAPTTNSRLRLGPSRAASAWRTSFTPRFMRQIMCKSSLSAVPY
jgi:uncharacterized repeat protein (TIGR03803 family)